MAEKTDDKEETMLALGFNLWNDENECQQMQEEKSVYGPVQDTKTLAVANFSQLELHTNLREPPANWLRGKKYFKVPRNWLNSESTNFSSLLMAERYPETVTEVNVITAAENIKKLLKMPFSKSQISMAVHRIDKTLLLDELDLYKHFGTTQSNDLDWFYSFVRGILIQDGKNYKRRKKHKENSQKWNLLSKFLYHSIAQCDQDAMQLEQVPEASSPEPTECDFARQVLWKFEDISMLLGTDLPIFGGGKFPAVSLKLRDASSPINVLTGMDYWLDNLMCNVPELAMCYHLDGFVQRYEVIKTEEIPHIPQAQFSPKVVKDVAQNILSFIKSNCTQEGHTYWLFKGQNDDVIKLYDLSSLSEDSTRGKNPFVMPVAFLLYKVARNMSVSDPNKRSVICKLLRNCIYLLEETGHGNTEIMAAATYLLSHTYLNTVHSNDDDTDDNEIFTKILHAEVSEAIKPTSEVDVRRLINPGEMVDNTMPENSDISTEPKSPDELAQSAVDCIVKGLKCIENCEPSKVCAGSQPIPLKYKTKGHKEVFTRSKNLGVCLPVESWQQRYKLELLHDGLNSFLMQAKHNVEVRDYGIALRHVRIAFSCFESIVDYKYVGKIDDCNKWISEILEVCGDSNLLMVDNLKHHEEEYNKKNENETKILEHTAGDGDIEDLSWAFHFQTQRQDCLKTAYYCYESILDHYSEGLDHDALISVTRKLGSARNELGIWFMNEATEKQQTGGILSDKQKLWTESFQCFEKGIKAFKAVQDIANVALLYNNMGRLMRLCAQAYMMQRSDEASNEFSKDERHYFKMAIDYYQTATSTLKNRMVHPGIWDAVTWELSTTYFTMATTLQDNAPLSKVSREEVEKEVLHLMHKVLSLSESIEPTSSNAILHQFRTANVYHRLGSMYHSSLRNQVSDKKKRFTKSLADNNYEKAENLFRNLERPTELLRVQLERVAMVEHQFHSQTGNSAKIKSLQCALEILLKCKDTIEMLELSESSQSGSDKTVIQNLPPTSGTSDASVVEKHAANNSSLVRKQNLTLNSNQPEKTLNDATKIERYDKRLASSQEVVVENVPLDSRVDATDYKKFTEQSDDMEEDISIGSSISENNPTSTTKKNDASQGLDDEAEIVRLQDILKSRIQYMLLNLVKIHTMIKRNKETENACAEYKKMYATSLRIDSSSKFSLIQSLSDIIQLNEKLKNYIEK